MRGRRAGALGLAGAMLLLSACGSSGGESGQSPVPSGQPARIVVAAGAAPRTLDPARATRRSERIIAAAVQTPLLTYRRVTGDDAATLRPALAVRLPSLTDDRLEYRFTLRPGLVYADGRLVKASDVERAIAHASRVATNPAVRDTLRGVVGAPSEDGETLRGVRADDRNGVVVVRLRERDGRLPLVMADPATAPIAELPGRGLQAPQASTGPLRVARVAGGDVELVANPLRAQLDTVPAARTAQVAVLGEQATAAQLSSGEVGLTFGARTSPTAPAASLPASAATVSAVNGTTWTLLLPSVGPFSGRSVREQLAATVDRRGLVSGTPYRPLCGLFPSWVTGAVPRDDCPPIPSRSDEAGSPLAATTIRIAVPRSTGEPPVAPAAVAARAVQALGATARLEPSERPARALQTGEAEAALVRTQPSLPHPGAYLSPLADIDALVAMELPRRNALPLTGASGSWSKLEERVVDRAVAVPVASEVTSVALGAAVDPRSVVLHPVLGLDLAALRLR